MTEISKLEVMDSRNRSANCDIGDFGETGGRTISVSDHINVLQHSSTKSEGFVLDMERFSHLIEKDISANSRITLQRNLSRKGLGRNGERKITGNDRDTAMLATSPRAAAFHGGSTPEKPGLVAHDHHSTNPQVHHHQITITNSSSGSSTTGAETKSLGKRFSFRRSSSSSTWTVDPRRILFFFATLSCMGTILLIYFTLSMGKLNGEENALD